jgi:hypothetical protein
MGGILTAHALRAPAIPLDATASGSPLMLLIVRACRHAERPISRDPAGCRLNGEMFSSAARTRRPAPCLEPVERALFFALAGYWW